MPALARALLPFREIVRGTMYNAEPSSLNISAPASKTRSSNFLRRLNNRNGDLALRWKSSPPRRLGHVSQFLVANGGTSPTIRFRIVVTTDPESPGRRTVTSNMDSSYARLRAGGAAEDGALDVIILHVLVLAARMAYRNRVGVRITAADARPRWKFLG